MMVVIAAIMVVISIAIVTTILIPVVLIGTSSHQNSDGQRREQNKDLFHRCLLIVTIRERHSGPSAHRYKRLGLVLSGFRVQMWPD